MVECMVDSMAVNIAVDPVEDVAEGIVVEVAEDIAMKTEHL